MYCFADDAVITGNTSVASASVQTYTVTWTRWGSSYEELANVSWNVTGGTIVNSDKHTVTIQWPWLQGTLDVSGNIQVMEDFYGQSGELNVTVLSEGTGTSSTCNGFLGPQLVYINFGSGSNPGPPLPAGTTTYNYLPYCAITPNNYTIVNNTNSCRSDWHNVAHDHTGNPNGYMLMVDGSNSRNEFLRADVSGLHSSFRYQFSAWCGNLISNPNFGGADPLIRFELYDQNGTQIATSGGILLPRTIPTFQWQQVSFMFDIPAGVTSLTIVVADVQTASSGNDLVMDDISFAPCYPPVLASFSNTGIVDKAHVCNNGTVNLYASWPSIIPFQNPSYKWQRNAGAGWADIPGAGSISYTQTENTAGIYKYRVVAYETSNPSQSVVSNEITYYVQKIVVETPPLNFYVCNGSASGPVSVNAYLQYADPEYSLHYTYAWSPSTYIGNPNANPTYFAISVPQAPDNGPAQPPVNYVYTLNVTNNEYGCTGSNTETIVLHNPRKVYVPSGFTPNNDGVNDLFRPINLDDYPGSNFEVFDRWGVRVFHSTGPTLQDYSWDGTYNGTPQPTGTYVWQVSMAGCQGRIYSSSDGDGVPHGTVVLIR